MTKVLSRSLLVAMAWLLPAGASANEMYFTQAKVPGRLSEQGLKGFMRGHHSKNINEERDHKKWKFNLGVFLRQSAGDLEAHILFYDVERGREEFVSDMTVFLSDRNENTFLQPVTLERPMFKPMNMYMAALQIKRRRLVKKDFQLVGQRDERSGVVAFSEEEAVDPEEVAARQLAKKQAEDRQREELGPEGVSEVEAREKLAQQADQMPAEEGGGGDGEPIGSFDEYGEIPDTQGATGEGEGGCASCRATGAGPPAALGGVFALATLLLLRRRRR